jgi:N-acyl-phosphatidylethanolamine-hydrolysing phospholipase D
MPPHRPRLARQAWVGYKSPMGRFDDRATRPARGPLDLLRWNVVDRLRGRGLPRDRSGYRPPVREPEPARLLAGDAALTWIGHATFVLRLGGRLCATDPIFSTRIAGMVKRLVPPGLPLEALPPLDVVVITHNHRDHLDLPTLRRIGKDTLYVVPAGNGRLLTAAGLPRVVELDWWETVTDGQLAITLVPARHWSMRRPWDRNDMLWGGFVLRAPDGCVYHSGDTGTFDGFREIGARLGPIGHALLPIGAYEPRWFMEPQHMSPEEAGQAFLDLGARHLVAMHWGTFRLTDEPIAEPPARIQAFFRERGLPAERLWVLDIGEHRRLGEAPVRP